MKVIGMIGGMSWESTSDYYRNVNNGIKAELGGLHSAKVILYSVRFRSGREDAARWPMGWVSRRSRRRCPEGRSGRCGLLLDWHEHDAQGRRRDRGRC